MFRAAYRSTSGAPNCICNLWFIYPCGDRPLSRLGVPGWVFQAGCSRLGVPGWVFQAWVPTQPGQRPITTWVYKTEALNTVWSSWWWAVMPLETCWAFNKFWNNKFYYKVASCWLFLLIHTTMHGSMNIKFKKELWIIISINVTCLRESKVFVCWTFWTSSRLSDFRLSSSPGSDVSVDADSTCHYYDH